MNDPIFPADLQVSLTLDARIPRQASRAHDEDFAQIGRAFP